MSTTVRPTVPIAVRRARWAVSALFLLNGAGMSSMVPRFPLIKENLGLTNTFFGLAIALGPLGGLIAGLWTSRVIRRLGSARVALVAQAAQVIIFTFVLNAPIPAAFALGIFIMSATDVYADIAMNAHGLRVQKLYGRSINNSFHAFWSVGGVIGGSIGALFAGINLPLPWHAAIMATLLLSVNLIIRRHMLPGPDHDEVVEESAGNVRIPRNLLWHIIALGMVAAFAASIEDSGSTWSALYLHDYLGATPAIAGLGFVALIGAQTIGRFTGDRLVDHLGDRGAARLGCSVATLGMALALAFPSIPLTLLGFAAAGWGVATVVPAVFYAGYHIPGLPHGAGLAIVNWLLRFAFLIGPPLVGRISDVVNFRVALLVMPLATLMVVLLSGHLSTGRSHEEQPA